MKFDDPAGDRWMVIRQVGAWRRRTRVSWAWDMAPAGMGSDALSTAIALPFLVLALFLLVVASAEMALLLVTLPVALALRAIGVTRWRVVVRHSSNPTGLDAETNTVRPRQPRSSTTAMEVGSMVGAARLRDAIAEHVQKGGDVTDPEVGQWLEAERGRLVSRTVTSDPGLTE